MLFAQKLADIQVLCSILCVVLHPWLCEAMLWIAREFNLTDITAIGRCQGILLYFVCGDPALAQIGHGGGYQGG